MRVDWAWIAVTFTWVSGLSLILATVSIANYRAALKKTGIWKEIRQKQPMLFLNAGSLLFLVGLLLTTLPVSQKLVWAFPAIWGMAGSFFTWRKM